jgi:uncharacterized repeat protein (TIGR03809 family)
MPDLNTPMAASAAKWRDLALRRHAHFVELYESGRWRHYYTESEFIAELHTLTQVVRRWQGIAQGAGGRDAKNNQSAA